MDPDQMIVSSEANWPGSTVFLKKIHRVQQDRS